MVDEAGHLVPWEAQEEVRDLVADFLLGRGSGPCPGARLMRRAGYLHLYGLNLVFDRVGKGPPVLLVAEEASRWPEALPEGYAFYLLDLPGYGRTEGPRMAPEELAHFVAGFAVMMNLGAPWVLLRGLGLALGPHLGPWASAPSRRRGGGCRGLVK